MCVKDMEELKEILNREVSCDNLTHNFVLVLSRKLDMMIVDYYRKQTQAEDDNMSEKFRTEKILSGEKTPEKIP